jgi:hypothetical protein
VQTEGDGVFVQVQVVRNHACFGDQVGEGVAGTQEGVAAASEDQK